MIKKLSALIVLVLFSFIDNFLPLFLEYMYLTNAVWLCREFRALVIEMVLATDMSFHFQQLKNMKNLLGMPEKSVSDKAW